MSPGCYVSIADEKPSCLLFLLLEDIPVLASHYIATLPTPILCPHMRQRGKVLSRGRWQQRPNMAAVADQAWIWTPSQLSPSLMTPYPAYP